MSVALASHPVVPGVDEVCRRLSAALGWKIAYTPGTEVTVREGLWSAPVTDGLHPVGRITLLGQCDDVVTADFRVAVSAIAVFAELLQRVISTQRKLAQRTDEVTTLVELGRGNSQAERLSDGLGRMLRGAIRLTGFWSSAFFLVDPVVQALRLRSVETIGRALIPFPTRSLQDVTPDAAALAHGAVVLDRHDPASHPWLPADCSLAIGVPVRTLEGPLGTLWCFERRRRKLSERHIHALQSVAAQMATVLERTVLLRDSQVRDRLKHELATASRHHGCSRVETLSSTARLEVAVRAASASELSGDLCEVWPVTPDRTFLAMGDAVGHSIPAALVMAVARGALRSLLLEGAALTREPAELVSRINQTLFSVSHSEQFMTFVCGEVDAVRRTLTYSNAGHPPPWLIRRGERISLKSHGLLCGVLPEARYTQSTISLEPGDLLIWFTDGISEALSRERQFFRTEGLLDALGGREWFSADEAAEMIWTRLEEHCGGPAPKDDQTLLVARVLDDTERSTSPVR
jgi:sigma-B regulation protein RsbU (phosphoserine phosphatase)